MFVVGNEDSKAGSEIMIVYYEYLHVRLEFYKNLRTENYRRDLNTWAWRENLHMG